MLLPRGTRPEKKMKRTAMDYGFPFGRPLEAQTQIMDTCFDSIEGGEICLVESPTGTGKSLALLCAALSWLTKPELRNKAANLPPWLQMGSSFVPTTAKKARLEKTSIEVKHLRIFFCTRTHSQVKQIVDEFKKTPFAKTCKVGVLGSRRLLCINEKVRISADPDEACSESLASKTSRCPFYKPEEFTSFSQQNDVYDIEDIRKQGVSKGVCPFYGMRMVLPGTDLVVVPYNYVLDRDIRDALGIELEGAVVIFDEGHNLTSFIRSNSQVCLMNVDISLLLDKSKNDSDLKLILEKMNSMKDCFTAREFVDALEMKGKNVNNVVKSIIDSRMLSRLFHDEDLINFKRILLNLGSASDSVHCFLTKMNSLFSLSLIDYDVDRVMREVVKKTRSVIVASGTLFPTEKLKKILFAGVTKKITEISCGHVIAASQAPALIIPNLQNQRLDFRHSNQGNLKDAFCALGKHLEIIIKQTTGGVVVFVSSYKNVQLCKEAWQNSLSANSFYETVKEGMNVFKKYSECIDSKRSALLVSVMGGSLSEGINFKDDLARFIAIVGVPFANMTELHTKRQYEYESMATGIPISGLLEADAMVTVNQAIGRAIRHKEDYCTIGLFDHRYASLRHRLPAWLRDHAQIIKRDDEISETFRLMLDQNQKKGS